MSMSKQSEYFGEVYKEKGKEPWKYTRQVLDSNGHIERLTTRYSMYEYAYMYAYDDFKAGKIDTVYLYHAWGTLSGIHRRGNGGEHE